ncbi:MAG: hypothetical protein HXX10_22260 [Rhodoplanes sp.]|uniref:hypothetical protein n=1 Tax=Rhodoplanes sp. TaxID=1968906 RepID=UPI0017B05886|nr:hypothetical protein [Rhodoplanes sp.]NVO16757.1 hypothetical protein [Rhodoplanes sp.]
MKSVTISLPDSVYDDAEAAAEPQGITLAQLVADLVEKHWPAAEDQAAAAKALETFFRGPGFPGISKNLPTREELYAERDDELARRRGDRDA